jgi:hypothetical protein
MKHKSDTLRSGDPRNSLAGGILQERRENQPVKEAGGEKYENPVECLDDKPRLRFCKCHSILRSIYLPVLMRSPAIL